MSEEPKIQIGIEAKCQGLLRSVRVLEGPSKKGEYLVAVGNLSMWVKAERLTPIEATSKKSKQKQPHPRPALREPSRATLRLDLHGMKAVDAERELEMMLDRALLEGAEKIEVVHGIGSGVLRNVVERFCKKSPHVARFAPNEQNPGSAWIYL